MLRTRSDRFSTLVSGISPFLGLFVEGVHSIASEPSEYQRRLNELRDSVRDMLTLQEPARFPRSVHHSIAVFGLLHVLFAASSLEATGRLICRHCHWICLCDTLILDPFA